MEPKFVLILDNSTGALSIIELTKEELRESESYEDFESFLTTIENKYGFRLTYSSLTFQYKIRCPSKISVLF